MAHALAEDEFQHLRRVRAANRFLRQSPLSRRNGVLTKLIELLKSNESAVLAANAADLEALPETATQAFRDRLTLTPERLAQMRDSLKKVADLPEPLGATGESRTLPNGLVLKRIRSPLGVIFMIFEARPNVITEAFSLALKSGNSLIMRGGSDSKKSAAALYTLIHEALNAQNFAAETFWGITNPDRTLAQALMQQNEWIDVLVPRGGDSLIAYVTQHSRIPIIKNDRGMCHTYIHEDANQDMAVRIAVNAKTQRPGVCNAMETLLLHTRQSTLLPKLYEAMLPFKVQWYACSESLKILGDRHDVCAATEESFDTEYLDFKLNCKIVPDLEAALAHIEAHGSRHSEAIVTQSSSIAREFQNAVDAAAVYWNASTRFTDGYEFGLGGELGISTQKLHVRGPVGLLELTSLRWIADGTGQVR